jgi:hypothetical protein
LNFITRIFKRKNQKAKAFGKLAVALQDKIDRIAREIVFQRNSIGAEHLYNQSALSFAVKCDCHIIKNLPVAYFDMAEKQSEPVDFSRN